MRLVFTSRFSRAAGTRHRARGLLLLCLVMLPGPNPAGAGEASVAVAANFLPAVEALRAPFRDASGHTLRLSAGATGQLYAQIIHGAPHHVFLAADRERPRRLVLEGHAVTDSRFTYAVGALALWSADPAMLDEPRAVLRAGRFRHLAIANPELAPYGAAARETLQSLGLWRTLQDKLVRGHNVAQAFQYVATGNAELGFVALSQVLDPRNPHEGSRWVVPASLHGPICQDAVLLSRGANNPAARAFLDFLRSRDAAQILRALGYRAPSCAAD